MGHNVIGCGWVFPRKLPFNCMVPTVSFPVIIGEMMDEFMGEHMYECLSVIATTD